MHAPCTYDIPWQGPCGQPGVPNNHFCARHVGELCSVCKVGKAIRGCDMAGSITCGAPLCRSCRCRCFSRW